METLAENIIVIEDDLILFEEADEGLFEEVEDSGLQSDDEYHPDEKARQSNQQVTTRNLQQWALAAASQFPDLEFKASEACVKIFKRKHRIRQKKNNEICVGERNRDNGGDPCCCRKFRLHTRALIPNYDKDFVLNTDQTGCQYQSTYNRTLAEQGSKVVLVKRKDM
ncbi:HTH CENPB-type domain-containing protein [Trichonephila clavipes]|nr:HTH CENPB-type domain-containing protein [Trichonephila clavipes]